MTQSETSDDAIRNFDSSMEILRRLDVATGYMELLAEVDALRFKNRFSTFYAHSLTLTRSEARKNFRVSPQAALQPYLQLQTLAVALKEAQPAAEDAAPHLVDHVDVSARKLWKQMKDAFATDFEETLSKMKWPAKDVALTDKAEQEWTDGVEKLLELQEPYVPFLPYCVSLRKACGSL